MITPDDAAKILGAIAAYDQRTVGVMEAQAWAAALNHDYPAMRLADAIQAVIEWHGETVDNVRMRPAHVSQRAKLVARHREGQAAAQHHAPGCRAIVDQYGQAAADHVRALPPGASHVESTGLTAVREVLNRIADRLTMPTDDEANLPEHERIHLAALRKAREDKRGRRDVAA